MRIVWFFAFVGKIESAMRLMNSTILDWNVKNGKRAGERKVLHFKCVLQAKQLSETFRCIEQIENKLKWNDFVLSATN